MSETRNPRYPGSEATEPWQRAFDELELRMSGLREAYREAVGSFALDDGLVARLHARFEALREQVERMRCEYPYAGVPGREACRSEPAVPYESDAGDGRQH